MKKSRPMNALVQKTFAALAVAVLTGGLATALYADGPKTDMSSSTNSVAMKAGSPASANAAKPQLTGAELYSIHCNRCHPERYPTERTAAQWKTIMLHMQVRASIPGKQSRLILQYLQENSGR
jgi:cytochrome c5